MATAPNVPDFSQYNFELGDTDAVVTKQNGMNAALAQFGENLKVMTDSINEDVAVIKGAYYGPLAEDPTEDPNGNPPEAGDRYYNTVEGVEKSYNGTSWQANEVGAHLADEDPHSQYEYRVLHNTTATRAPTATDDSAAGYAPRSTWFDNSLTPPEAYRCINATAGAAVWVKTTLTLDELGSAATESAAALRARSTHTGTQPLSTIIDAGTAAAASVTTSDTDATPGRVLRVNAFGLGSSTVPSATNDDLNAIERSGLYRFDNTEANRPCNYGTLLHISRTSADNTQLAFDRFDEDAIYFRKERTGVWGEWVKLHHSGDSDVDFAGTPTVNGDPIVASGSNSYGSWARYSNGVQDQWGIITLDNNDSAGKLFSFPRAFLNTTDVFLAVGCSGFNSGGTGASYLHESEVHSVSEFKSKVLSHTATGIAAPATRPARFKATGFYK